eukprot:11469300-Karenia_brevis.AAC.1
MYPNSSPAAYVQRSILGMPRIYNKLPAHLVEPALTVAQFQRGLQDLLKEAARDGDGRWQQMFSTRVGTWEHPLNDYE